jgi:hypothetical protein
MSAEEMRRLVMLMEAQSGTPKPNCPTIDHMLNNLSPDHRDALKAAAAQIGWKTAWETWPSVAIKWNRWEWLGDDERNELAMLLVPMERDLAGKVKIETPESPPSEEDNTEDGYPAVLEDAEAIASYIADLSPTEVDEEFIAEHFWGCRAELRMVPVSELREGDADTNMRSLKREKKYAKMDLATMPPLVVENGEIKDGNHRFRVAIAKGATEVPCYVVVENK